MRAAGGEGWPQREAGERAEWKVAAGVGHRGGWEAALSLRVGDWVGML